ncbi:UNVERIFIED_CONTAM: hypothetical protein Sindi_2855400 [Sesamum indicum]
MTECSIAAPNSPPSLLMSFVGKSQHWRSRKQSSILTTTRHPTSMDIPHASSRKHVMWWVIMYAGPFWIFFRSGRMLRQLNHTIIALVPKSEHSTSVVDYRPISCCNVIYKAITKIISDPLAPAFEHLIDRCQSAFIGGRNITDNIFLA